VPEHLIRFSDYEWENTMPGVRCKIYRHGGKQLRLVEYTPEMPLHWCERGHYGYILEGEFEIEYPEETVIYKSGDGLFIPEGEKHRHRARAISESVTAFFVEEL